MTAMDRFDPFEQRIVSSIDEIAAARRPDYLDDILRQTARTSQRPRWSFPGRWIPMDTTLAPVRGAAGRFPARVLLIIVLAALIAVAGLVIVAGARNRTAPPFGLAQNGQLVYAQNGDLYVADGPGINPRVLIAEGDIRGGMGFSPNGDLIAYPVTGDFDQDTFWAVDADGSDPRPLHEVPIDPGYASAAWSPDSRTFAIAGTFERDHALLLAAADGSGARTIEYDSKWVWDVAYNPRDANRMLLRIQDLADDFRVDLAIANGDGSNLTPLGLRAEPASYGAEWVLSGATWSPAADVIAYNNIEPVPADGDDPAYRVHLVNADGTNDRALPGPDDPLIDEGWPTFSPDGKWLLVHRWQWRDSGDQGDGWMAIMPADGSAPARDIGPRLTDGSFTGVAKGWSPDGTRVLVEHENGHVWVIDPFANTWERLEGTSVLPDWQRRAP